MKRLRMQTLGTWATELEVIAAASLLNTTIYIYAKCGETFKWFKHSPQETKLGLHQVKAYIYLTSTNILKQLKRCNIHTCCVSLSHSMQLLILNTSVY